VSGGTAKKGKGEAKRAIQKKKKVASKPEGGKKGATFEETHRGKRRRGKSGKSLEKKSQHEVRGGIEGGTLRLEG